MQDFAGVVPFGLSTADVRRLVEERPARPGARHLSVGSVTLLAAGRILARVVDEGGDEVLGVEIDRRTGAVTGYR